MAREIHENINAITVYELRNLVIWQSEGRSPPWYKAPKQLGFVVLEGHVAVASDMDEGGIVMLQHRMHEVRDRVRVEIR